MNGARRHLTAGQRAAIALELLPAAQAEAAKREHAGKVKGGKARVTGATVDAPATKVRATDQVAHLVGLKGGKSIERTAYVT